MNIEINNGLASIHYKRGRAMHTKNISLDDFISAVSSNASISTPLLPPGTRFYSKKNDDIIIGIEIPTFKRTLHYLNKSQKTIFNDIITFPWTLFLLSVSTGGTTPYMFNTHSSKIYALKQPIKSLSDELFHYPMPNIYGEGRICWGSTFQNNLSTNMETLSDVGRIIDQFFSSNFNTDIHPTLHYQIPEERYEDFLRRNNKEGSFNLDYLVKQSSGFNTIQQLINHLQKGA